MARRPAPLWLLVLEVIALQHMCLGSHSLNMIYFLVLEPNSTSSHIVIHGYVDNQIVGCYDSNSRKIQPRVSWTEKLRKEDPQYWQALTEVARSYDDHFSSLEELGNPLREVKNIHIVQGMESCEFQENGSEGVFWIMKMAVNGETEYAYDSSNTHNTNNCFDLPEKCLSYGNEMLMRTETPVVTLSSRTEVEDGMETHVCRIHGFYPMEINASWTRDGEIWEEETFHGSVAPNADGTYHYWISIWINPKERDHYRCHVKHNSLQDPLDLELKVPESNLGLILGCVVAGLVVTCVIVGSLIFLRSHSSSRGRVQGAAFI